MLLGGINRIGGIVFGFLEGGFVICMVLYMGTMKPVPDKVKGAIARSKTAQAFASTGSSIAQGWEGAARRELSRAATKVSTQ